MSTQKWSPTSNQTSLQMVNLQPLQKIVECTIYSPYIQGEKPLSLLIVAKPESGKTSVLKMYRENRGIVYITDCTAYGLTRDILPKIVSREIKTIIIPDLMTPLSKQTKTRQAFIAFLNNLIEEGVAKVTTYANIWEKDVNANVITAVTDEALRDGRHNWAKLGFLSRFVIFSYSYSLSTVQKILETYSLYGPSLGQVKLNIPDQPVDIHLPKQLADKIDPIATQIGRELSLYGFRAKINFRCLLKTLAYRNKRHEVTDQEFSEFLELANFMNFKFNPL